MTIQSKSPSNLTVKYWGGPLDGKIKYEETVPANGYYLTVKDNEEIKEITSDTELHHYQLFMLSSRVFEYKYKGIVTK